MKKRSGSWIEDRGHRVNKARNRRYAVLSAEASSSMAERFASTDPTRFQYFPISWQKFPDGTDNITISGFQPSNDLAGEHVLFFASFHNNDVTLSQFSVLIVLLQSFIESMTILLPFYPVGTMERVDEEGKVATANTYSTLLSSLPQCGKPNRIMLYDIHALQERFYFHGHTIPSLHTSIPLLLERLRKENEDYAIAFPDDGAAKRFSGLFKKAEYENIIVCGKVRDGNTRIVRIQDGDAKDKRVVIVDDLIQTGGTLYQCALALQSAGALCVNAFVAHGVFPNEAWRQFSKKLDGKKAAFGKIWLTNSIPSVTDKLPSDDVFEVLDLVPQIAEDLDLL